MIPNCFDERYSYILRFIMNDVLPERIKITEGHTDSTPVDKYIFTWTTKGVRCHPICQL